MVSYLLLMKGQRPTSTKKLLAQRQLKACATDDVINDVKFRVWTIFCHLGIKRIFWSKNLFRRNVIFPNMLKITCAIKNTLHHQQTCPQSSVTLTLHTRYKGLYSTFVEFCSRYTRYTRYTRIKNLYIFYYRCNVCNVCNVRRIQYIWPI